jgi:hypothetical protein
MIIKPPPSNRNFTQIPNEILYADIPMADKLIWMQLRSLCPASEESHQAGSISSVGRKFGISPRNAQKLVKNLVESKLAVKDGEELYLLLPGEDWEAPAKAVTAKTDDKALVRDVWNEFAPDSYVKLRKPLAAKTIDAIMTHMEHLKFVGTPSELVKQVLAGAKAHDRFWLNANARPEWIFGSGDPTEKKFSNVETLYKLGNSKAGHSAAFNASDDRSWVDWFSSKGSPEYTKVKRLETEDRFSALDHYVELKEAGRLTEDTILIYSDQSGRAVYWTGQNLPQFRYLP